MSNFLEYFILVVFLLQRCQTSIVLQYSLVGEYVLEQTKENIIEILLVFVRVFQNKINAPISAVSFWSAFCTNMIFIRGLAMK